MFKFKQTDSYFWPVEVSMPADGGQFEKSTFDVEFKRVGLEEIEALAGTDDTGGNQLRAVVLGWKGVVNDANEEVPFSPSNLEQLLRWPTVRVGILAAWRDSIAGAKRKN